VWARYAAAAAVCVAVVAMVGAEYAPGLGARTGSASGAGHTLVGTVDGRLAVGAGPAGSGGSAGSAGGRWVAAWAASPAAGTPVPKLPACPAGAGVTDATVRDVVFASVGGGAVRVRLSNAFGTRALRVGHASVAVRGPGAAPAPGTLRALTFGGRAQVTVPAGGQVLSDPVPLAVAALSSLLVSVHLPGPTGPLTFHPFTKQANYLAPGDRALDGSGAGFGAIPCWLVVDAVDVRAPDPAAGTVVALGDSITDLGGRWEDPDRRWPDDLARRLAGRPGPTLAVVDAGLAGNELLYWHGAYWGEPALARLDRDVFGQAGVRTVILLEGTNDIASGASAERVIGAYRQVIARSHARGLRVLGGTVTPFGGAYFDSPARRQVWAAVNAWIRSSGAFDGVVDFAAATAAPGDPSRLAPAFDSGDHLHPGPAGCQAMADAIDLGMLLP